MEKKKESINVIIETPRGYRNKYVYDENLKAFRLKKILPVGAVFPFDFGFIPGTKAEDGDPLDVLVMMDEPAFPGCVIECRIIGALKAKQSEKDNMVRNDRLIAVSIESEMYKEIKETKDLSQNILDQIEHFFISYNQQEDKKFLPQGWADAQEAIKLIEEAK